MVAGRFRLPDLDGILVERVLEHMAEQLRPAKGEPWDSLAHRKADALVDLCTNYADVEPTGRFQPTIVTHVRDDGTADCDGLEVAPDDGRRDHTGRQGQDPSRGSPRGRARHHAGPQGAPRATSSGTSATATRTAGSPGAPRPAGSRPIIWCRAVGVATTGSTTSPWSAPTTTGCSCPTARGISSVTPNRSTDSASSTKTSSIDARAGPTVPRRRRDVRASPPAL